MIARRYGFALALLAAGAAGPSANHAAAQTMRAFTASRAVGRERQLRATLDFGAGTVRLAPASAGQLYRMQLRYDAERYAPVQQYEPRNGILRLGLESVGKGGMRVSSRNQLAQSADVAFSASVPLSLTANLGASEARLDLGGLTLTEFALRSGATRGTVDFSAPTRGTCRSATLSVGATEITVLHLANAACGEVRIDGGVGRASLDFSGQWRRNARVVIDLAMGSITLRIPRGTGVRLVAERFLSRIDADGLEKQGNIWTTPGFDGAARKIDVELKTAMAGVNIEWIE